MKQKNEPQLDIPGLSRSKPQATSFVMSAGFMMTILLALGNVVLMGVVLTYDPMILVRGCAGTLVFTLVLLFGAQIIAESDNTE